MESLRLVPSNASARTVESSTASTSHVSFVGVHDSMRHGGPRSLSAESVAKHPLQARLQGWEATQQDLKFELQRNLYGMHFPLKGAMERQLISFNTSPSLCGPAVSNLHLDILNGKDESLDLDDVLGSAHGDAARPVDIHAVMENRLKL